ncbi:hypothetical protein SAMN06297280_1436 [Arsukibacterium tuosuense]|uniref:Ig-like domain-containing protein n=1 Tax=Arsukibacterium tuosuense TaxID=1323745 RepID=A0A285IP42_9GAMM|nr:hypothetical protein [Arsukibacterium tuosuense]SNY49497.1 hypothetical protein SAMN06297280_1436 [Arsukibacterium tuosuense]
MKQVLVGAVVTAILISTPQIAAQQQPGQSTHCQLGESVRVVEVVYPQGGELPCEVQYTKDGATSMLWQAQNDAGYCEQQAADFVEKLRGWGFECVAMPAGSKAEADDDGSSAN